MKHFTQKIIIYHNFRRNDKKYTSKELTNKACEIHAQPKSYTSSISNPFVLQQPVN